MAAARAGLDLFPETRVGLGETSVRRGQDYVSTFMDLDWTRVVFATEGRDSGTGSASWWAPVRTLATQSTWCR